MAAKIPYMVAAARKPGRPRRFEQNAYRAQIFLPDDLRNAAEVLKTQRKLPDFAEACRELMREAAEARGLVEPRQ